MKNEQEQRINLYLAIFIVRRIKFIIIFLVLTVFFYLNIIQHAEYQLIANAIAWPLLGFVVYLRVKKEMRSIYRQGKAALSLENDCAEFSFPEIVLKVRLDEVQHPKELEKFHFVIVPRGIIWLSELDYRKLQS